MKQEFTVKFLLPDGWKLEPLVMKEILERDTIIDVLEISTPNFWSWKKK